ncbi:ROK family protein [Polaromonas sp. JS666]|uniref:ROK family protein n=1 Tax=Polaromonas sp. (strain JS666 / ATCC BAA-500) TaxID=296591 RepID=UPI0000464435|nr:ROK family protein [Polaromonas sp. JS666]ABE45977.1 glucokinase [Polaromonas sp. JS666]
MKACVDLGGTKVALSLTRGLTGAAAVPPLSALQARRSEPTAKTGTPDAVARQILRMLGEACAEAGIGEHDIVAVGVSSCGPFVMKAGMIELAAPNICGGLAGPARGLPNDWTSALLEAPLREKFRGTPTTLRIENDGIGALEAERRWGALQGMGNCAYVTWSTGIGCGLCVDGRVLRGKHGNAGHAGHMFVSDNDDALCGCGNIGDLEGLVAGNAIARRFSSGGAADAASILAQARSGDAAAVALVDELCRVMGRALYNLIITLDLERISLGGSVFWHHRDYLLPRLQAQIAGKLPALTSGCTLVPAGLGERVGDFGALALVS